MTSSQILEKIKKYLPYVAVAAVFFALGVGGMYYYQTEYLPPKKIEVVGVTNLEEGKPAGVDFGIFWQTWDAIQKSYVGRKSLNIQEMVYGAAKGLVNSLEDPYSGFMTPPETEKFEETISGKFEGIGIEIGLRKGILTVVAPLEGTPAKAAGLKSGDQILKIGDKTTIDMTLEEAVSLIRGPKGTTVTLTISRKGFDEPKEFTITRNIIDIPSVNWIKIDDDIAHLKIYNFNERSFWEFRQAAINILNSGRRRIIIDVRDNAGGFLESSIDIAGWFLPRNAVVVQEDEGEGPFVCENCRAKGNARFRDYKIVILVNGGSASASEILAGALRDNAGLKLIGETTFGKGSVQELQELAGGSTLKITIAKWLTPAGVDISEKGLAPDIEVKNPNEDGEDLQLQKAIEVVRSL
jgi:carboxyl-terminal processing protease